MAHYVLKPFFYCPFCANDAKRNIFILLYQEEQRQLCSKAKCRDYCNTLLLRSIRLQH